MKIPEWLDQKSGKTSWVLPSAFLSFYVILDWNAAWSGGSALLGNIIPVAQVLFILYLGGICVLMLVGLYLIRNRKFILLILYLFFIAFFIHHLSVEHDELIENGKRNSRNALQIMLISPEKENVWYVAPSLEKKLLSIKNSAHNELVFVGSSSLFHTYVYDVKTDGVFMFNVEVLLLRKETRFIVQEPKK